MGSPAAIVDSPVRSLGTPHEAGYTLLSEVNSSYRDGGEETVLAIINAATDVSSTSDEMIVSAKTWAERYHLAPARANVLRALDLPPDARVLEVGAGCGAITRLLGENCALVDAIEPVPARAAAAVARTRDLTNVSVFVGSLDDVPAEPTYDLVVVVGVLEYVGAGSSDLGAYVEFLADIYSRLNDGGQLVLAIENKLGAKYLAGAPEDHTSRVWDSIENYPIGGKARTFSRVELEALMVSVGFRPSTLVAFPDYKMTRVVMSEMPAGYESLLYRIPRFPSPDWSRPRPKLADEAAIWRTLVDAGVAMDFGNSFVVIAGKGDVSLDRLWPADRLASFYSHERRSQLTAQTTVEQASGEVYFVRHGLQTTTSVNGIRLVETKAPYEPGRDLLEVVAEGGLASAAEYLPRWRRLVEESARTEPGTAIDLVPHNLIVNDQDELKIIDIELFDADMDVDTVVRRGVYWFTSFLTRRTPPQLWQPHTTIGEVMVALGSLVGLPADGSWIDLAIAEESELATRIRTGPPTDSDLAEWREQLEKQMYSTTKLRLVDLSFGDRLPEHMQARIAGMMERDALLAKRKSELEARDLAARQRDALISKLAGELAASESALQKARNATLEAHTRRAIGRVLPRGTRRRRALARIWSRRR